MYFEGFNGKQRGEMWMGMGRWGLAKDKKSTTYSKYSRGLVYSLSSIDIQPFLPARQCRHPTTSIQATPLRTQHSA